MQILIQQGTGNNNSWGVTFNNSFATPSERADAGVNTITATSGTVDLSTTVPPAGLRLDIDHIQLLTGALTADLTVKVPNVSKTWHWWNKDHRQLQTLCAGAGRRIYHRLQIWRSL